MGLLNLIPGFQASPFGNWWNSNNDTVSSAFGGLVGHGNDPRDIMKGAVAGLQHGRSVDEEQAIIAEKKAADQAAIAKEQAEQAQTVEWLMNNGFEHYAGLPPALGFELASKELAQANDPDAENFFGNVVPFETDQGIQFGQIGDRGTFRPLQLPEGARPAPNTRTVDTPTHQIIQDVYGNEMYRIPKDNRQAEQDKAIGRGMGESMASTAAAAPAAIGTADTTLQVIDNVLSDPHLDSVLGINSMVPVIPGDPRAATVAKVEQLQGQAFLTAFATLKGSGAITEREGEAATKAIARLQRNQDPESFRTAVAELRAIVHAAKARAEQQMQSVGPAQMAPASSGGVIGYEDWLNGG